MEQYAAQTVIGIEDIAIDEISDITGAKAEKAADGRLVFSTSKIKELIYTTRSLERISLLLARFTFDSLEDIEKEAGKIKFSIGGTFAARCERHGFHDFTSQDIERSIGEIVHLRGFPVDLKNPSTTVFIDIIDSNCFIGIELAKNLQKRDYRVKANSHGINPCVAYAMLKLAEWEPQQALIDTFCRDGIIPIEAASVACNIPRGFFSKQEEFPEIDKRVKLVDTKIIAYDSLMPNIRSSEINAKLANVNKQIQFSRSGIDWLDIKFTEASIDRIVTKLPQGEERELDKEYRDFFYQAEYILKKGGRIAAAAHNPELVKKHAVQFRLLHEREVRIGGLKYSILVLEK